MKTKHLNLLLFVSFLAILMVSVPSLNTTKSRDEINIYDLGTSQVEWNESEYEEFVGPPIYTNPPYNTDVFRIFVDDTDPNYNWSKTETENEWCSGSGTSGDPYIIEGLYINAQGEGGGIYIRNSDKHFIIRDCWVNNSGVNERDAAVYILESDNGIIKDNIFTFTRMGVGIQSYCDKIEVLGNYMVGDPDKFGVGYKPRALRLANYCNDINFSGNIMVNFYDVMHISRYITNITLKANYVANFIFKEWEDPPVFFDRVNGSQVTFNILDGVYSQLGVFVDDYMGGNNLIVNNTVVSAGSVDVPDIPILSGIPKLQAPDKIGVSLQECFFNVVAHNIALEHTSEEAIPGYDTLLILSLAGFMITVLIIKISFKKLKQ